MSDQKPNLDSLFEAAVEIQSAADRAAFLKKSCGDDLELREQLERLLQSNDQAGSFLDKLPVEMEATILTDASDGNLAAALDAGLAPAFTAKEAVVISSAGHSVLKTLGQTIDKVPRVALRDSVEEGAEPIVRPKSPEMPQREPDSRYRLDGEIARGGMGAILKGRDTDLGRDLAIKVLLEQHKDKPEVVQRFVEEAQIGGQLQHPGIAPVYELGQFNDRRPFFSMKLVKGETFSKLLADRESTADERGRFIGIFEQICQTMAYAHSRGVIHRDLKPANIMVGAFGEVQVMDWGLAKVLQSGGVADEKKAHDQQQGQSIIRTLRSQVGSDPPGTLGNVGTFGSQTQMGSVMGTPAYMPPEQALGEIDNLDERADVFGLGAILCEILTGQPPYVGNDGTQVYRMASRGKLTDCFARLAACGADAELVAIAKHCLEPEPKDRPRDAGVLAARITAYLASVESRLREAEVERAMQAARAEEALQTAKEHEAAARAERHARKLQMGLAAVVLGVLTVGGIAATWTATVQSRLKNDALLAEQAANNARKHAETEQARAESEKARAETEKARAEVARRQAEEEKVRSLNVLADMQTERGIQAAREGQAARAALWFANAAALTPHDRERQVANQRRAKAWSGEALLPVALLKVGQDAKRIAFQPGGTLLLTVGPSGLHVWDWRNEVALPWSEQFPLANDAEWSPNGQTLAAVMKTGEVRLLDPVSGQTQRSFQAVEEMGSIEWAPDGSRLAVAGWRLHVWNVVGEPVLESDWAHPKYISGVCFNRSGTRLVTACEDDLARVFAINEPNLPAPLYSALDHRQGTKRREAAPVFCADDRRLVTLSSATHQPVLRDAATGTAVPVDWKMTGHFDRSLDVSPDGRWIAVAGGSDGALLSADGKSSLILPHANHLHLMLLAPDGRSLATLGYEGIVRLFSMNDLTRGVVGSPTIIPQQNTFANGAFSPDSQALAISSNNQVVVWERQPASPIVGELAWTEASWRPRPSFDGQFVTPGIYHEYYHLAGFPPRKTDLQVARMTDGSAAGPAIVLTGSLVDSCVASDNASVAAVTVDQTQGLLSLFDIATGTAKWPALALPAFPLSVAARPGRPQLAVLCQNGDLLIIDVTRGAVEHKHEFSGVSGPAAYARVAYSPDGATIVTVLQNSIVSIRDAETGLMRCKSFSPLIGEGLCRSIAFSPDSRLLATAVNGKNMAQVWSLATGEKVGVGMSHPGDLFGIWSITFSPDGTRLLTSHKDGRVRTFDWRTSEMVGTPLQHPDEVNEIALTPDGRHLLACVRHGTLHVWDVATGKLAVPLVPQLKPDSAGASTQSVGVAGDRAVVSAGNLYSVLALSTLLPPIDEDVPSLLRRAELATNQKLQVGELVPLELHEWSTRWEQLVAARQTPDQVAESLAQVLDAATDASAQSLVIARASRRGLLEELLALRPKSLPLLIAVALEQSKRGRLDEALKRREQVLQLLRGIDFQPVGSGEEKKTGSMPIPLNDVARLLTVDAPRGRWLPLEPAAMKGRPETTFARQPNGFVLTGIGNAKPETYVIEARPRVKRIAALRLDVAPHASLPDGAGHGNGNFCLTEFRARVRRADGTETSLKLTSAVADYVRELDTGTKETDGPWAVLDGDHESRWDIFPYARQPHWIVLIPDTPCDIAGDDTLIVELDSGHRKYPDTRLGHFRLSVSEDSRAGLADDLIAAVRQPILPADEMLAVACLINGEAQVAINVLQRAPHTDSRNKLLRALLLATAQEQLGLNDTVKQLVEAGLSEGASETYPHSLTGFLDSSLRRFAQRSLNDVATLRTSKKIESELARLTQAIENAPTAVARYAARGTYLARLGRWQESAADFQEGLKQQPDDRIQWLNVANTHLMAGDEATYRELCSRMLAQFQDSADPLVVTTLCKVCLLRPEAVELSELPIEKLNAIATQELAEGRGLFSVPNSGLAAYRAGRFDEALEWLGKSPSLKGFIGAQVFATRALVEEKLGRHDDAVKSLSQAEALIPDLLADLGTPRFNGSVPVAESSVTRDNVTAELLRREAALLLHKAEARTTPFDPAATSNPRSSAEWAALGEWAEAAKAVATELSKNPRNRVEKSRLAALQLLAGDVAGYRQTCESGLTTFSGNLTTDEAESLTKTCLLGDSGVEHARLPIKQLRDAVDDPKQAAGRSFYLATSMLAANRAGEWELVLLESQKQTTISGYTGALLLVVRAIAEERLGQHEQALQSLKQAEKLIPSQLRTLGTAAYAGPLPVPDSVVHVDWLIPEVLRREAALLIRKDGTR